MSFVPFSRSLSEYLEYLDQLSWKSTDNTFAMVSKLTRFEMIDVDAADGHLDGHLTWEQAEALNPDFAWEVDAAGLFDLKGNLPYAKLLDSFGSALGTWEKLTSRVEEVPLVDSLILGQQTGRLQERISIHFENAEGGRSPIPHILKAPNELYIALITRIAPPYDDNKEAPLVSRRVETNPLFDRLLFAHEEKDQFEKGLFDGKEGTPREIFEREAKKLLDRFEAKGFLPSDSSSRARLEKEVLAIRVYRDPTPEESLKARETLQNIAATLAYRFHYFLPRIEERLLRGALRSVGITEYLPSGEIPEEEKNPFKMSQSYYLEQTAGHFWYWIGGQYSPVTQGILMAQSTWGSRGADIMAHEMGHALWTVYEHPPFISWHDSSLYESDQVAKVVSFFISLPEEKYADVFLDSSYGHPENELIKKLKAGPENETHSRLVELTEIGFQFPEVVRERLLKKTGGWRPEEIDLVYRQLTSFRAFISKKWGFLGHPVWADRFSIKS